MTQTERNVRQRHQSRCLAEVERLIYSRDGYHAPGIRMETREEIREGVLHLVTTFSHNALALSRQVRDNCLLESS